MMHTWLDDVLIIIQPYTDKNEGLFVGIEGIVFF